MSILLLFYQSFKSSIFYTFYYKQQTLKVFSWRDKDPPKVETTALLCMLVIVANSLYKTISILIFNKPKLNLCFGIFLKKISIFSYSERQICHTIWFLMCPAYVLFCWWRKCFGCSVFPSNRENLASFELKKMYLIRINGHKWRFFHRLESF